jgi:hypothetical protein
MDGHLGQPAQLACAGSGNRHRLLSAIATRFSYRIAAIQEGGEDHAPLQPGGDDLGGEPPVVAGRIRPSRLL